MKKKFSTSVQELIRRNVKINLVKIYIYDDRQII